MELAMIIAIFCTESITGGSFLKAQFLNHLATDPYMTYQLLLSPTSLSNNTNGDGSHGHHIVHNTRPIQTLVLVKTNPEKKKDKMINFKIENKRKD